MPARPQKKSTNTSLNRSTAKTKTKIAAPVAKAARIAASGANTRRKGHLKASAARAQARRDGK